MRDSQGFGSTGWNDSSKDRKDSSRVSVMQRIQGKPTIKKTNQCWMQREFVSMKQMKKLMKQKETVFLCIIKAGEETLERKRRLRGNKKSKSLDSRPSNIVAQDSRGMTEKTKREHSNAVGPRKKFKTIEEATQEAVEGVAKEHQANLRKFSQNIAMCSRMSCQKGLPQDGR